MLCFAVPAQTAKPTFEVASVKPATPLGRMGRQAKREGGPGTGDPVRYTCGNCPVYWVLSEAYDIKPYQYIGPDWVNELRFDFDATMPKGTTKEGFHEMLQTLLTERFKLALHREPKELQVYELTVLKGGPKFHESGSEDTAEVAPAPLQRDADGFPILPKGTSMAAVPGHARIRSDARTMSWLAQMLSGQMQSAVIDATGLAAKYDYQLSWSYERTNSPAADPIDESRLALMQALQSQLGLRLESKKGIVDVLVVEHIEKVPTEN